MSGFQSNIYNWFLINKRDLPWRNSNNPYHIWLSEVILQQTRVVQGTKYYLNFLDKFPTIKDLASASEDEVLKLWQGLGYYSRARNLHYTAKQIVEKHKSIFPSTYDSILNLKGVGQYTAAAISSMAYNLPHATVDGNIYRVLSRYFGIETPIDSGAGKKEFFKIANDLLHRKDPGMHNQAFMEFGALQCTPKSPDCKKCPVSGSCFAFEHNKVDKLPVKTKKIKQSNRYFYYYYIDDGKYTYLDKRINDDIWKNLHQFPLLETQKKLTEEEVLNYGYPFQKNINANVKFILTGKKHILSHQIINATLICIELYKPVNLSCNFIRINKKDIFKFAVPKLLEQFIDDLNFE